MPESEPPPDRAPSGPPSDRDVDLSRRRFFRAVASDAIHMATSLVGAAGALQRGAVAARDELMAITGIEDSAGGGAVTFTSSSGLASPDRWAAATVTASVASGSFRSPFRYDGERLILIDQRRLPDGLVEVECRSGAEVAAAIKEMVIRGAPALGQAAAYALALTAHRARTAKPYTRAAMLRGTANALLNARPTAVNIAWAVERMLARWEAVGEYGEGDVIADALRAEADAMVNEAMLEHAELARHGAALLPDTGERPLQLLTHCNTGPLACGMVGTALGVVQRLHADGRPVHVWVGETRPYLQGARLTAWELAQAGVPYTVATDAAAGWLLSQGKVDAVLVGADRIAANGDAANKIGTYPLAVLAARHRVPFYVCAPTSSVDLAMRDGAAIPIEQRGPDEVIAVRGVPVAPPGSSAINPAFDVTPGELITAIVTEEGVVRAPYGEALAAAVSAAQARRRPPAPPGSSA